MVEQIYKDAVELKSGCQLAIERKTLIIKGEKGEVKKIFSDPAITLVQEGNVVNLSAKRLTKRTKKLINTYKAHINNMCKGVTEGHVYKLRICSGHFPMTVSVKEDTFEIKNFIGEKVPRTLKIKSDVTVKIDGTEVIVESIDKEKAGQMAASIENLTKRPGFDTRIFQDGIYIIEKDGKIIK